MKRVGLLDTAGTVRADIYNLALEKNGFEVIYLLKKSQDLVMKSIYRGANAGHIPGRKKLYQGNCHFG